jgi:chromate transporter
MVFRPERPDPSSLPVTASSAASPVAPVAIFVRFLRFGLQAWGGPVAQIAMVRRGLVDEEGWISSGRFNRLLAIYQVLPGPEAHELCVHLGMIRGGRVGGVLAGLGFMLPGLILMLALSWLYLAIDLSRSALGPVFLGVQVGVIALIVRAIHRIGGHVLVDPWLWAIAALAGVASYLAVPFWLTLPAAGVAYLVSRRSPQFAAAGTATGAIALAAYATVTSGSVLGPGGPVPTAVSVDPSPMGLFLSGLKAGVLTFGGAYTVIPFLRDDAVANGWMPDATFLDGLALSGILPAPLIIFSTFVGYVAGGLSGALAMTIGIFLPAFAFSLVFFDRLESVVDNLRLHALLEGVAAGVVGLIVATTVDLSIAMTERLPSMVAGLAIFAVALAVLFRSKARTTIPLVILGAGLAGWLLFGVVD